MTDLLKGRDSLTQNRSQRFERRLYIANLQKLQDGDYVDITDFVTDLSVSYTMDMASLISFNIIDQNFEMFTRGYFRIGRDIIYDTNTIGAINAKNGKIRYVRQLFEISSVTMSQGPGGSPAFSIQCYSKAIQQMKRDKNPSAIQGNGSEFIRNAAKRYGLGFYGEETTKNKEITQSSGSKQAESLWDVMTRLAGEAKFVLFEVDGILVFASETWLLNKWGTESVWSVNQTTDSSGNIVKKLSVRRYTPLTFYGLDYQTPREQPFVLTQLPQFTKSENDPYAESGSCSVVRTNATQLRPGMTVAVSVIQNGVGQIGGNYIIESVTFQEMVPDPVSISFRTPTKDLDKVKIEQIAIGEVYQQTYVPGGGGALAVRTVAQAEIASLGAKDKNGNPSIWPILDSRIIDFPKNETPFKYPTMEYANITISYPAFVNLISSYTGFKSAPSTNDRNSNIVVGNLNLFERPIYKTSTLISRTRPQVVDSYIYTFYSGSEWRSVLIPAIYAYVYNDEEAAQVKVSAVRKSLTEAKDKYLELGGFEGSAKHFGVFRGETYADANANARDYLYLLVWQQEAFVLPHRFSEYELPQYVGKTPTIPTTPDNLVGETFLVPVALDSYWED
jgi:hypothetical protein